MTDETVRLSMIGQIIRRRWPLLAFLAVLGALVGAGSSVLFSPGYESSTGVLLQGAPDASQVATEATLATSTVVLDRAANGLGWHPTELALRKSVTTSSATGNIVTITGTASTPARAKRLTDEVAKQYVAFTTQLGDTTTGTSALDAQQAQKLLGEQVASTDQKISQLAANGGGVQLGTALEALRSSLDQAISKLDSAGTAQTAVTAVVIGPASFPSGPAAPTPTQLVAGGVLVGVLVGIVWQLLAVRADQRLRRQTEVAAALNAPVLGTVDAPGGGSAAGGLGSRLRRVVVPDRPLDLPTLPPLDAAGQAARYKRVLTRLRGQAAGPLRALLLVPDDDDAARHSAQVLATTAHEFASLDRGDVPSIAVEVVDVSVVRPTIPDVGMSLVLVVLTAGTRTGSELVGITQACADAGYEVTGAVVTYPASRGGKWQADATSVAAAKRPLAGDAMAGVAS
ncbi:MAG: exopolysaccharide biosynthesis protein [Sciscionella sp.]